MASIVSGRRARRTSSIALVLLLSGIAQVRAAPARDSITVMADDNYAPYVFIGPNGTVQGILVDQWKAWEKATGIRVDLKVTSWALAQLAFNRGEADVLDTVFVTEERKKLYSFSKPYARIDVPIFMHRTITGIAGASDLRGFRVAVKHGDAAVEALAREGVKDIVSYPSYEAIVEAAAREDIRIFCIDAPPAYYYLNKRGIGDDFRIAFILNRGEFHRAVLKGNEDVLKLVEDGFAGIPTATFEEIDRKWMGSSIPRTIDFRIVGAIGAAILALVLMLVATSWELRRRVARATADLNEKVKLLESSEAKNRAFIAVLPDIFFTIGSDCRFIEFNTSKPELLALPPETFLGKHVDEVGFPDEAVASFRNGMKRVLETGCIASYEYDLPVDDATRTYEGRIVPLAADRVLLLVRDITENRKREDRLRVSLLEKEILLKEIHHRVKNNMQVISSLIQLQSYSIRDELDRELLRETQARIRAMATVHELLYESQDFSSISADRYLGSIVEELSLGYDATGVRCDVQPAQVDIDTAVPLGLVANELIINAIKYAYDPGAKGPIRVTLRRDGGDIVFSVSDDGKGLPAGIDPYTAESMGLTLVRSLAAQLRGRVSFGGGPGFSAELRFAAAEPKDQKRAS